MSKNDTPDIPAGSPEEGRRFEEIYDHEVRLPEALEGSVTIVSCLSWRDGQQVYLVRDDKGRPSILKMAQGGAASILLQEAENLKSFRFSFLPQYLSGAGDARDSWLQREYIPGDTLWELVERKGPLPPKEAGELLCRLCELTGQLHEVRPPVICRDIKPQNIVLTPEGNLFLIDFGTAREYREEAAHDTVFMGTRLTAAPEQYGYRQTDCRTDIYALGAVYLYLLTGNLDVQKHSAKSLLSQETRQIIEKCTRLDPQERYQSCKELQDAIREAAGYVTERKKKKIRRRWQLLAAALVCVAMGLGCYGYLSEKNKPYQFHSELIEAAVRKQLGKEPGEPIQKEELAQIETLRICGGIILEADQYHGGGSHFIDANGDNQITGAICDVTDCSYMTNLHTLVLDQQQITDISPLAGLPIENLYLGDNPITDLSPLAEMENLETLYVDETAVSDLTVLKDKTALTELGISDTQVADLQPLQGLNIERLMMFVPDEADWDVLVSLPLKKLVVHSYSEGLEEKLGTINTLEDLTIYSYQHTTLEPLQGLTNLTYLDLYAGNVESLEGVGQLEKLNSLTISKTRVTDLTPLQDNRELSYLKLDNSLVTDFSPLLQMQWLETLECSQSQKQQVENIIKDPQFEIAECEDDPLE